MATTIKTRGTRRRYTTRVAAAVALLMLASLLLPGLALANSYPDVSGKPAEIQSAIDYSTTRGFLGGAADGKFYPDSPTSRLDYAVALVKLFKQSGEAVSDSISFTDIPRSDPNFRYAALAVQHHYLAAYGDGSFKPGGTIDDAGVMSGLVVGLGLDQQAAYMNCFNAKDPSYAGLEVVAHDLHLKYSGTQVWPQDAYPRGEFAYSLQKADQLEQYRADYVRETFTSLRCQAPMVGAARQTALDSAFAKIGVPYVWGGESDAEHGYDCSGLVYYVMQTVLKYPMQRVADDQARDPRYRNLSMAELMPGDPIFFFRDKTQDPAAYIGHAGMYVGQGLFIHSTGSNAGVSVDQLSGYYVDHFAWGKRVINEDEPASFDTYILLCNPGDGEAEAMLTYMMPDGSSVSKDVVLAPRSRVTVKVDDTLLNKEVSTKVQTIRGTVVAERSMYFTYQNKWSGGHASVGVPAPAREWYLPEGCTAYQFDTYVLVQNPGDAEAHIIATFMDSKGGTHELSHTLAAHSRYTINARGVPGLASAEFSTKVVSDQPVVVEHSIYYQYRNASGGSNSPGATATSPVWYFAEGYTGEQFDTYLLLMNPDARAADVTLSLLGTDGKKQDLKYTVAPHSRYTVHVDDVPGWANSEFSTTVSSPTVPIVAERSMYFVFKGNISDGHAALGSPGLGTSWYLPEGYTADSFDSYVLLENPNDAVATANVRFMLPGGKNVDAQYQLKAHSRFTIHVDAVPGLSATEVSTQVTSDRPILAEHSLYYVYHGEDGGSSSLGVTGTSPTWYFAEGYTGM